MYRQQCYKVIHQYERYTTPLGKGFLIHTYLPYMHTIHSGLSQNFGSAVAVRHISLTYPDAIWGNRLFCHGPIVLLLVMRIKNQSECTL